MAHKLVKLPRKAIPLYVKSEEEVYSPTCQLQNEADISPCSEFDHCTRPATIWLYSGEVSWVYGYCNTCYNWCYPSTQEWYRVVRIAPEFKGRL